MPACTLLLVVAVAVAVAVAIVVVVVVVLVELELELVVELGVVAVAAAAAAAAAVAVKVVVKAVVKVVVVLLWQTLRVFVQQQPDAAEPLRCWLLHAALVLLLPPLNGACRVYGRERLRARCLWLVCGVCSASRSCLDC